MNITRHQVQRDVRAIGIRDQILRYPAGHVGHSDWRPGNIAAGLVSDGTQDASGISLREGRQSKEQNGGD